MPDLAQLSDNDAFDLLDDPSAVDTFILYTPGDGATASTKAARLRARRGNHFVFADPTGYLIATRTASPPATAVRRSTDVGNFKVSPLTNLQRALVTLD